MFYDETLNYYLEEERIFVLFFLLNLVVRNKICLKKVLFVLYLKTGSRERYLFFTLSFHFLVSGVKDYNNKIEWNALNMVVIMPQCLCIFGIRKGGLQKGRSSENDGIDNHIV